jgi:hypothetical protein
MFLSIKTKSIPATDKPKEQHKGKKAHELVNLK